MNQSLATIVNAAETYASRMTSYVSSQAHDYARRGTAVAVVLGMLAVPAVPHTGRAEPGKLGVYECKMRHSKEWVTCLEEYLEHCVQVVERVDGKEIRKDICVNEYVTPLFLGYMESAIKRYFTCIGKEATDLP